MNYLPQITFTSESDLSKCIVDYYLHGKDFNGFPMHRISGKKEDVHKAVTTLIKTNVITATFGDNHPNPYIKAFDPEPISVQLQKINTSLADHACFYPSRELLSSSVNRNDYEGKPFSLAMALGEPQLIPRFFDLTVLEFYRNDPRYYYAVEDAVGWISIKSEFYDSADVRKADQILLENFGFGYSKNLKSRVVVAFLRYLYRLSPEHQQQWATKELHGDYFVHPIYANVVAGVWPQEISIFNAVLQEMALLNQAAQQIKSCSIFKEEFMNDARPREFTFLMRPTMREYYDFVIVLDQMISENLNRTFFVDELEEFRLTKQKDGSVLKEQKGTITLLSEWLDVHVTLDSPQRKENLIKTFRNVRDERSIPAHKLTDNKFDMALIERQRSLIIQVYKAMQTLREILQLCPSVSLKIPTWYTNATILAY